MPYFLEAQHPHHVAVTGNTELTPGKHNAVVYLTHTADLNSRGIMSLQVDDLFLPSEFLLPLSFNHPIPLDLYSQKHLSVQEEFNTRSASIWSHAEVNRDEQTPFDKEDITPLTWKWVDLELQKEDGTKVDISLRRPNWWITESGADAPGSEIWFDMPEMGLQGMAQVKGLRANHLDTRFWNKEGGDNFNGQPITGKFVQVTREIYLLYFEDLPQPIGVTGSHMIWSIDHEGWVSVKELQLGENVRTSEGSKKLMRVEVKDGEYRVYNLEVYRNHNYLVSSSEFLVHNVCWWGEVWQKLKYKAERNPKMYGNVKVYSASKREGDLLKVYVDVIDSDGAKTDFGMTAFLKETERQARKQGVKKVEIAAYPVVNKELKKGFEKLDGKTINGYKVSYSTGEWGAGVMITKELD